MTVNVDVFKVFTSSPDEGNSAGVIAYNGETTEEMLDLAKCSGTSITVFVHISKDQAEAASLRYFSHEKELAFCGHGTLAAGAFLMNKLQKDALQVTYGSASRLEISKSSDGSIYFRTQRGETLELIPDKNEVASMLGVQPDYISMEAPFCVGTIGSPKLMVPFRTPKEVDRIIRDDEKIKKWSEDHKVNGVYVYSFMEGESESSTPVQIYARGFNPLFGIAEDAATGVAAGALGDILARTGSAASFIFHQGKHVNAASEIRVEIKPQHVEIGGQAVFLGPKRC